MFAKKWGFQHITSSPWYPQSNGKVENAVKTIKWLFSKCHETGQSELLALLDWRNTPTEGLGSSPAQRFFGRRCRIQLPMTETLLNPPTTRKLMPGYSKESRRNKHSTTIGRLMICSHFELERFLGCNSRERRDGPQACVRASKVLAAIASKWVKQSITKTDDTYSKEENCQ